MITLYGREWKRQELLRRIGSVAQVGGIRRARLVEGVEEGTEVLQFRTGTGFAFTVVPSRGMAIADAEYRGTPLAWLSSTGLVAPQYYRATEDGWERLFFGGLLTPCGMMNVGRPCEDEGEQLGLHGNLATLPAHHVIADQRWEGNALHLYAQGKVLESAPGKYALELTRNISTYLGANRLYISDIVENVGYHDAPFMFLYHINIGFPILDEGAEVLIPAAESRARDRRSEAGLIDRFKITEPVPDFQEQVFYHDVVADENRHCWVGVVNRSLGLGVYVRYHKTQFPNLVQWKMLAEGTYVLGIEPANCLVEGRAAEREQGTLEYIEVGGRRHFETEIGVLTTPEEIEAFESRIAAIRSRQA
ncbi:MAG: DUF4432 domain-containing protein [Candidatus Poribacteria bacterium]|nr:MAG: DUF4432 domain-containing protein [Candidatus Poribacteria bacterium]